MSGKIIYLNWGKRGYVTLPLSVFFKTQFQSRYSVQILKFKRIIEKDINCQIQNFLINTKLFPLIFLACYVVCIFDRFPHFTCLLSLVPDIMQLLSSSWKGTVEEKVDGKSNSKFSLIPMFSLPEYFLLLC